VSELSKQKRRGRPPKAKAKAAKVEDAELEEDVVVRVEIIPESQVPAYAPNGPYWVRYECPYVECRAKIDVLCFAHAELWCAHCHTKMKTTGWRKADQ
jgi:hypothetical protein